MGGHLSGNDENTWMPNTGLVNGLICMLLRAPVMNDKVCPDYSGKRATCESGKNGDEIGGLINIIVGK